jgi:hypothetical protein
MPHLDLKWRMGVERATNKNFRFNGLLSRGLLMGAMLLFSLPAFGQSGVGGGSWSGYTFIPAGTVQLTFDNLLLVGYDSVDGAEGSDTSTSALQIGWTGGLGGEYFFMENLSAGLDLGYIWENRKTTVTVSGDESSQSETDGALIGFIGADYYLRLGNSMFIKPGLGAGYFSGSRSRPVEGTENQTVSSDLSGFAGRLELGGAFYASEAFSLRGTIVVLARMGSEAVTNEGADPVSTEDDTTENQPFTAVDAAFSLGFGYAF